MSYLKEDEIMIVKSIKTPRYLLELIEVKNGGYRVHYDYGLETFTSKSLKDLNVAMMVFDDMLCMLEGD